MGELYRLLGDYALASEHLEQALQFYAPQKHIWQRANAYNNLAMSYQYRSQYEEANMFYNKAITILKKHPEQAETSDFINFYNNLAMNYFEAAQPDTALRYLQKAMQLHQTEDYDKEFTLHNLGTVYTQQEQFSKATQYLEQALQITLAKKGNIHPETAQSYLDLGNLALQQNHAPQAIKHYQKALHALQENFNKSDIYAYPRIEEVRAKILMVNILSAKADAFVTLHKTIFPQTEQYLTTALRTYQLAADLIDQIRQTQKAESSKLSISGKAAYVYEKGFETAWKLFDLSKDSQYFETMFYFSEKSKAALLYAAIKSNEAQLFANIPDSLRQLESDLKADLTFYNKAIFLEKQNNIEADTNKLQQWQHQLFITKRQLETLKEQLAKSHPQYFAIQYNPATTTIADIQTALSDSSTMFVEYFVASDHIYIFHITTHTSTVSTIPLDDQFQNSIDTFLHILTHPPALVQQNIDLQQYTAIGHHLYEQLLNIPLDTSFKKLIISPDGILSYLPFEALVMPHLQDINSFRLTALPYLIKAMDISYTHSATLWLAHQHKTTQATTPSINVLAFAPVFEKNSPQTPHRICNNGDLSPLQFSIAEVQNIQKITSGKAFLYEQATKEHFLKNATQSRILHLATHACLEDNDPMNSRIFFAQNDFLSTYDLYNLHLPAELTVLSACNTGSGQWIKGEGIMSLSRGFFYAGCPSVIMSLWSVDDQATSQIMQYFYQYLSHQQDKDAALRQAKLHYLAAADKKASHPFYWAAFVPIGNMQPLVLEKKSFFLKWAWSILISSVGIFFSPTPFKKD